jgi:hypothetical protein
VSKLMVAATILKCVVPRAPCTRMRGIKAGMLTAA